MNFTIAVQGYSELKTFLNLLNDSNFTVIQKGRCEINDWWIYSNMHKCLDYYNTIYHKYYLHTSTAMRESKKKPK